MSYQEEHGGRHREGGYEGMRYQGWDQPPTEQPKSKTGSRLALTIVGLIVLFVAAVGVWIVVTPKALDKVDTGVRACKFISEGKDAHGKPTPSTAPKDDDNKMTSDQYKKMRSVFAESRHNDIETAGTKFADSAWQMQGGNLLMLDATLTSYTELTGACANHGYPLPPLADISEKRD